MLKQGLLTILAILCGLLLATAFVYLVPAKAPPLIYEQF